MLIAVLFWQAGATTRLAATFHICTLGVHSPIELADK